MKILLEIDGWEKIIDIEENSYLKGYVTIGVLPKLFYEIYANENVPNISISKFTFFHHGLTKRHLPVFTFEE